MRCDFLDSENEVHCIVAHAGLARERMQVHVIFQIFPVLDECFQRASRIRSVAISCSVIKMWPADGIAPTLLATRTAVNHLAPSVDEALRAGQTAVRALLGRGTTWELAGGC